MTKFNQHNDRKLKLFLVVVCLIGLLFCFVTVNASTADTVKIVATTCKVERGETASMSFNLQENPGIWGMKFRVKYDTSALTLNAVTVGSVFAEKEFTLSEKMSTEPYVIVALGDDLKNKTNDGEIITLKFVVSQEAAYKDYAIKVDVTQVINAAGENVRATGVDGCVTVEEAQVIPPGNDPGDEPGNDPGDEPGNDPGDEPGNDPGDEPGNDPGDEPGNDPGDEPSDDDELNGESSMDNETADTDVDANKPENEEADEKEDADTDADEDKEENGIATGDGNMILPYVVLLAAAAMSFVVILKRRRG